MPVPQASGTAGRMMATSHLPDQGRIRPRGDADQRDVEAAGVGDDVGQFRGLARVGQDQHHVAFGHHAKVTMARLGGVNEMGGRAGGGEGRGDLAGDMAGFAHARDDDPALGRQDQVNRLPKTVAQAADERGQRRSLLGDDAAAGGQESQWWKRSFGSSHPIRSSSGTGRQEGKATVGKVKAVFADQTSLQRGFQPVQIQHVRGGIFLLRVASA